MRRLATRPSLFGGEGWQISVKSELSPGSVPSRVGLGGGSFSMMMIMMMLLLLLPGFLAGKHGIGDR